MTDKAISQAAAQAEEEVGWRLSRPRTNVAVSGLVIVATARGVVQPLVMLSRHQTSHLTHAHRRTRPKIDGDKDWQTRLQI